MTNFPTRNPQNSPPHRESRPSCQIVHHVVIEPPTVGDDIMRARRPLNLAWTWSWFSIIFNIFALGISSAKSSKPKKQDHLGSDLSYHCLEAEANSADSMVNRFNNLSTLNCIRWWSSTFVQDIHNPQKRITKGERKWQMNGLPAWRISDIDDESMGIWWHIDPSPIPYLLPTHFLLKFLISKPQTGGVQPLKWPDKAWVLMASRNSGSSSGWRARALTGVKDHYEYLQVNYTILTNVRPLQTVLTPLHRKKLRTWQKQLWTR